jgi:hypothetical protein
MAVNGPLDRGVILDVMSHPPVSVPAVGVSSREANPAPTSGYQVGEKGMTVEPSGVEFERPAELKSRRKNWALIGFALAAGILGIRTVSTFVAFANPDPRCDFAPLAPPHTLCASNLGPGAIGVVIGAYALVGAFLVRLYLVRRAGRVTDVDDSVLLPAPPPDLTPAMVSVLRTGRVDSEAFGAALADLIERGLIALDPCDGLFEQPTIRVSRKDSNSAPSPAERPLGAPEAALLADIRSAAGADGVLPGGAIGDGVGARLYDRFRANLGRAAGATWFTANPISVRNTWIAPFGALAVAVFAVWAFGAQLNGPDYSFTPVGWVLASTLLCLLVILVGAYSLYVNRTKAGAYQLAMAIAYQNSILHEWGSGGSDAGLMDVGKRFPWMCSPNELTVWMLALGFGNRDNFDAVRIDLDRMGSTDAADRTRSTMELIRFRAMAAWLGHGATLSQAGTLRVAGALARDGVGGASLATTPVTSTPSLVAAAHSTPVAATWDLTAGPAREVAGQSQIPDSLALKSYADIFGHDTEGRDPRLGKCTRYTGSVGVALLLALPTLAILFIAFMTSAPGPYVVQQTDPRGVMVLFGLAWGILPAFAFLRGVVVGERGVRVWGLRTNEHRAAEAAGGAGSNPAGCDRQGRGSRDRRRRAGAGG